MKYGAPVLCNELFWSLGNSMAAVVLGRIGAEAVAANSICDIVFQMTSFFIWGAANAASVMTGNTIGAGEKERRPGTVQNLYCHQSGVGHSRFADDPGTQGLYGGFL